MVSSALIWIFSIIATIILLWYWRKNCKWKCYDSNFPTLGHIIILGLLSLIPIYGLVQFVVLIGMYIWYRVIGDIALKPTKFNKIFFDVKE